MRRLLVTGAAGTIGTRYASWASDHYDLTLLDLPGRFTDQHAELGRLCEADISELAPINDAFTDIDTVIHLGGEPRPWARWSQMLDANIVGTYNVVAAACAARCRRIVYASSVHVVSAYGTATGIMEDMPVRPGDLYGVTKCFGEALGSYVAATEQISFAALRIGAFRDSPELQEPDSGWMLQDYVAPTDLFMLMDAVIEADDIGFEIYNAVSANTFARLPIRKAYQQLKYRPHHDSFQLSAPFREALEAVGGIADRSFDSGLVRDTG